MGHLPALVQANRAVLRPDLPARLGARPVRQRGTGSRLAGLVLEDWRSEL
jgi:hypothetical protein